MNIFIPSIFDQNLLRDIIRITIMHGFKEKKK